MHIFVLQNLFGRDGPKLAGLSRVFGPGPFIKTSALSSDRGRKLEHKVLSLPLLCNRVIIAVFMSLLKDPNLMAC